jgi:hypothetical protein
MEVKVCQLHDKGSQDRIVRSQGGFRDVAVSAGPQQGYLPLREAAKWAGVSSGTMKRWFGRGLPRYQAGPRGKVLVRQEDIEAFLQRQEVPQVDLDALVEDVLMGMTGMR